MIGAMDAAGRVALWLTRKAVTHHLARGATVDIARAKAGIPAGAPVMFYRFTVTRYREELP